jgi:hypothetical protein
MRTLGISTLVFSTLLLIGAIFYNTAFAKFNDLESVAA